MPPKRGASQGQTSGTGKKVLVIDDDAVVARSTARGLRAAGFDTVIDSSGANIHGAWAPLEPQDDANVIELWLRGRSVETRRAYEADAKRLLEFVGKPLRDISSADLVRFSADLVGAPATRARRVAAAKSLLGFACRLGVLRDDPARTIKLPRVPKNLNDRVLEEEDMPELFKEAATGRNRALLRPLYFSGTRIQEAVGLRWRDVGRRWISVRAKGSKSRVVIVPEGLIAELRTLRPKAAGDNDFVFSGRGQRPITTGQARRIVRAAGLEALAKPVSPHWLRHYLPFRTMSGNPRISANMIGNYRSNQQEPHPITRHSFLGARDC